MGEGPLQPHLDNPDHRAVAEPNTVLLGLVGSTVHGVTVDSTDDRDEMGICIEPPEHVAGLRPFAQWVFRTQPEGARSGPGDVDRTVYSLRKWCRLALSGNPTVMLLLHVPEEQCSILEQPGRDPRGNRQWFAARRAGRAYLGYMQRQRDRMTGDRGQMRVNRPELIERAGPDAHPRRSKRTGAVRRGPGRGGRASAALGGAHRDLAAAGPSRPRRGESVPRGHLPRVVDAGQFDAAPLTAEVVVQAVARHEARPNPARDRLQLALADQCANLVLRAVELDGDLADGEWGGPLHGRSIARSQPRAAVGWNIGTEPFQPALSTSSTSAGVTTAIDPVGRSRRSP